MQIMNPSAYLSLNSKQGKLFLVGVGIIFLLIVFFIASTCSELLGCNPEETPSSTPIITTSNSDMGDTTSSSDVKSDLEYGILPTDGSVALEPVCLLNLYHDSADTKNGTATLNEDGSTTVFFNGQEVSGDKLPERYTYEDGTVVWNKKVWIKDGVNSVTINIIPHFTATDYTLSVTYPNGKTYTTADNIFTFPSESVYRWHVDIPMGGIYTFTMTGTDLDTYYVDVLSYS